MSEEYRIQLDHFHHLLFCLAHDGEASRADKDQFMLEVALVERVERLVSVLEQIRDRLPGQIAR